MSLPEATRKEMAAMPAPLRELLEAELAAGNDIAEVGHTFPAPPAGAYFRLTKPLLTRAPKSCDGIDYYDRNGSTYSGEITDTKRFYFLLEPPHPPEPEPDMDAIRAARVPLVRATPRAAAEAPRPVPSSVPPRPSQASRSAREKRRIRDDVTPQTLGTTAAAMRTPVQRFQDSMVMDYDKWHDGLGYDLDILRAMSVDEKKQIEALLLAQGARDWRDVEALACLDTVRTRAALTTALGEANAVVRNAIIRYAPELMSDADRTAALLKGLESAVFYGGLTQTLDQVAEFHPPLIVAALLRGALNRAGDVAVHFAAMLCYVHGQAKEPFEMNQRPFFLRFNTDDRGAREAVFRELCDRIGIDPVPLLDGSGL